LITVYTLVVGLLQANCYLAVDNATRDAVLVDPGAEAARIAEAVRSGRAILKHILLTHGHPDHSWAAGEIQRLLPEADVLMHPGDHRQLAGEPELVALFCEPASCVRPRLGQPIGDGDSIHFGSSELRVLHTPGHTEGSVCFVAEGLAFTGDTLFAGGVGRTDLEGGSYDNLMLSLREKLFTLPDSTVIYPGHGPSSTIGDERVHNPWVAGDGP
jgi:glyoxylase-like metal-dependent hydrolase (beta-lactamase superfamily II)